MSEHITLVSHALCPYVQRAAIALTEKGVAHDRVVVDLANKPDWFLAISPLGRTPVLRIGATAIFESAAILEYLEETQPNPLHPAEPAERARHRAWIGFSSEILNDIAGFYSAPDERTLEAKAASLNSRFRLVDQQLDSGPWFAGARFSLVDAVFAPVFRYFNTFDQIDDFGCFDGLSKLPAWRAELSARPSVKKAVSPNYGDQLVDYVHRKNGGLARRMKRVAA